MDQARIFQINLSEGGVPKRPVRQAEVESLGLVGDRQQDQRHHGGPDRALVLFSLERIAALQAEGHPIYPGSIGENLTVAGLDWDEVVPGTRLRLGPDVLAEVVSYTTPCNTIRESFREGQFMRVAQERHPGWSRVCARVLTTGRIRLGDPVRVLGGEG